MSNTRKFSDLIYNTFDTRKLDIAKGVEGNILTLLDAVIPDKEQRESAKSLARRTVINQLYDDMHWLESLICTYVYEYMNMGKAVSESRPHYHTENRPMTVPVDYEGSLKDVVSA